MKKENMNLKSFIINGHSIPWSFYQRVVRFCMGDKYKAALVFFRCAMAVPDDPIAWVSKGLDSKNPYALRPCKYEERGSGFAKQWIAENIETKKTARRGMVQMKDALRSMLTDLEKSISDMPPEQNATPRRKSLEQLELFGMGAA